ncbi:MAG TPA: hypothetical protein VKE94_23150 [Gemmataceae bacterium]|nr:hypothetical protein [Gemmataceae bacterium]
MSITRPPIEPRESRQAEDVDGLLRKFFQSALPRPWPAFQRPIRDIIPLARSTGWRRRFRSSLALAASVAILALGLGMLPRKFDNRPPSVAPGDGSSATHVTPGKDMAPRGVGQPEKK